MKRICKIKIGLCLTAILMPVLNMNAIADGTEPLPAATVTAEGRKMPATTLLIKTNTLYDAALTPNIGMEVGLGKGWSIAGNVMYGWWTDRSKFYWRAYSTDIGVRRYFGSSCKNKLSGHHLGLYAGMMTWDFELGGHTANPGKCMLVENPNVRRCSHCKKGFHARV